MMNGADIGYNRYVERARRAPVLTREHERALAVAWRDRRDESAKAELAESHLRLVISMATKFAAYGISLPDLVADGNLGLLRAIEGYDPDRELRLSTYAMWWIRAMIYDHLISSRSVVKAVTSADDKKLFFMLRRVKRRLGIDNVGDLSNDEARQIAEHTGTRESSIRKMDRHLSHGDTSLNIAKFDDGPDMMDTLISSDPSPLDVLTASQTIQLRSSVIADAVNTLNPRERHIFEARVLAEDVMTLEQLGNIYGVTRERIRQVEVKALTKVSAFIRRRRVKHLIAA